MKALLVGETRDGRFLNNAYELVAFAKQLGAEMIHFLVGSEPSIPLVDGTLYLADASLYGEYNPAVHRDLLLKVVEQEAPDLIVFCHSSYGWDLAPRVAWSLKAAQISEVVEIKDGALIVPTCNGKLRRVLKGVTSTVVVTLQAGAFALKDEPIGCPRLIPLVLADTPCCGMKFINYEAAEKGAVDLTKAEVIVSAGRGIGKQDNLAMIEVLAKAMGGEFGASRPVVDAGWVDHSRQVGSTGQTVSPKVYIACGISGAIQHLAGMKKSGYVVAINTDKDSPIAEVADVLVVADLKQVVPAMTAFIQG